MHSSVGFWTKVTLAKDLIHAVRHAQSEYALFTESQGKRALLEEDKKKKEEAAEAES